MGDAGTFCHCHLLEADPIDLAPDELAVFVLNVGDGDAIVIRFPIVNGESTCAIVDSSNADKTLGLLDALAHRDGPSRVRFACATHPHEDHIAGLGAVVTALGDRLDEFWDSGFPTTTRVFANLIMVLRDAASRRELRLMRPTAGFELYHAGTLISVLSPSLRLRNQHMTYGLAMNNASVVLRLEYPQPLLGPFAGLSDRKSRVLILGADAQTDAWAQVLADYPHLHRDKASPDRLIPMTARLRPLASDFFKVSHHGSKRGVSLEVLERLGDHSGGGPSSGPTVMAVSSASGPRSQHGFPHTVTSELIREVRQATAARGGTRACDVDLGVHFTSQMVEDEGAGPTNAGSIAYVVSGTGKARTFRFGDAPDEMLDLERARLVIHSMSAKADKTCRHCCGELQADGQRAVAPTGGDPPPTTLKWSPQG